MFSSVGDEPFNIQFWMTPRLKPARASSGRTGSRSDHAYTFFRNASHAANSVADGCFGGRPRRDEVGVFSRNFLFDIGVFTCNIPSVARVVARGPRPKRVAGTRR